MPNNELKFCILCGKNKPIIDFVKVILARIDNSVFVQEVCKSCETVIHNIRRVVKEAEEERREELEKQAEKKLIVVPSLVAPRDIKMN